MTDKVYKLVEIVGTSPESIEKAIENAVAKASQTVHNLDWFQVVETRGRIEGAKVGQYQVTIRIGFRLD